MKSASMNPAAVPSSVPRMINTLSEILADHVTCVVCYNNPGVILENGVPVVLSVASGCATVYCQECFPLITKCVSYKCSTKWPDGSVRLYTMAELNLPEGPPPTSVISKCQMGNRLQKHDLQRLNSTLVGKSLETFSVCDRKSFTDHFQPLVGNEDLAPILTGQTLTHQFIEIIRRLDERDLIPAYNSRATEWFTGIVEEFLKTFAALPLRMIHPRDEPYLGHCALPTINRPMCKLTRGVLGRFNGISSNPPLVTEWLQTASSANQIRQLWIFLESPLILGVRRLPDGVYYEDPRLQKMYLPGRNFASDEGGPHRGLVTEQELHRVEAVLYELDRTVWPVDGKAKLEKALMDGIKSIPNAVLRAGVGEGDLYRSQLMRLYQGMPRRNFTNESIRYARATRFNIHPHSVAEKETQSIYNGWLANRSTAPSAEVVNGSHITLLDGFGPGSRPTLSPEDPEWPYLNALRWWVSRQKASVRNNKRIREKAAMRFGPDPDA